MQYADSEFCWMCNISLSFCTTQYENSFINFCIQIQFVSKINSKLLLFVFSFLRFNFDKDSKIGLSQTKTNRKNPMFPMKASVTLLFNLANPVTSFKRSYLFRGELLYFFWKINNTMRGLLTLSRPASEVFLRSLYPT